jgi:hypothetical protein
MGGEMPVMYKIKDHRVSGLTVQCTATKWCEQSELCLWQCMNWTVSSATLH